MSDDEGAFGAQLRARRLASRLSQQELAERSGLSVRTISDLENGRTRRPYQSSMRRLGDALELSEADRPGFAAAAERRLGGPPQPPTRAGGDSQPDGRAAPAQAVPRQLPARVSTFVGRHDALAVLSRLLDGCGATAVITAIGGMAGVGKTALAVQWAHQVAPLFPDGQLYVNLRGYDADHPVSVAAALARFLRALGASGPQIPAEVDERAAEYRSLLAGRRMLVVLDNARQAQQVRPLLPGSPGCMVVVTSRDSLAGLVARDGAVRVELDTLAPDEAVALLRGLVGARVDQDPDAAAALADRCCRLPLALRVAAESAVGRPAVTLAGLVDELADGEHRLDRLDADGDESTAVRAVLSWSYRHLEPDVARAFRLLGLHPGTEADRYATAALIGASPRCAEDLLGRLARAHLVQDAGAGRAAMHDLLRAYARELAAAEDGAEDGDAALTRLLDHYLHTAAAAMNVLYPTEARRRPRLPASAALIAPVSGPAAARAWLDAERGNLVAAAAYAADHGRPDHTVALAAVVERHLNLGYHLADASAIHRHALRAARHGGDLAGEAAALSHLGFLEWLQNRFEQAAEHQRRASALFRTDGNRQGEGRALHRLALAERSLGHLEAAAEHAERVVALSRQDADRLGEARALQNLGLIRLAEGRWRAAADGQRQALALFDALGDLLGRSTSVKALGVIDLRLGRLESAERHFRLAMALCRETGNADGLAAAISALGLVRLRQGRHEQAAEHQRFALAQFRELRDRHGEVEALTRLALTQLQADRGRQPESLAQLDQALRIVRRLDARPLEAQVLNSLGEALLATGDAADAEQARAHHGAALDLVRQTGDRDEEARAHDGLARAYTVLGDESRARRHLKEAMDLYTALEAPEADRTRIPTSQRSSISEVATTRSLLTGEAEPDCASSR